MKIEFAVPHVFVPGSYPEENKRVYSILISSQKILRDSCGARTTLSKGKPGCVVFDLPLCFDSQRSDAVDNAKALQCLLHCLAAINLVYLQYRSQVPELYSSGVYYDRTMVWDSIPALYARGYGDCKSLTAALLAERALQGRYARAVFRWIVGDDTQTNYHILVLSNDIGFEDPSKVCGMEQHENSYFSKTG